MGPQGQGEGSSGFHFYEAGALGSSRAGIPGPKIGGGGRSHQDAPLLYWTNSAGPLSSEAQEATKPAVPTSNCQPDGRGRSLHPPEPSHRGHHED